jgi:pyruvate kinase
MDNVAIEVESDPTYRDIIEASARRAQPHRRRHRRRGARDRRDHRHQGDLLFHPIGQDRALTARERPRVPILALTPLVGVARRCA